MIDPVSLSGLFAQDRLGASSGTNFFESEHTQQTSFVDLLTLQTDTIDKSMKTADKMLADYIQGADISTHELMIAMNKAEHSINMMVQMRNRVFESYQEIARMQV